MENLRELMKELNLDTHLTVDEIPDLDLYMDQVIQLFENKYATTKRNENEKILTKTMINNYAKGKLFFPVKNKKYAKEHIMLISMIYQMKSTLSINDIKQTLARLNLKITEQGFELEDLYKSYVAMNERNVNRFYKDSNQMDQEINDEIPDEKDSQYIKQLLLVASFAHMSNVYRKAAEKIVDDIEIHEQEEKGK
ncbi:DUF1836 domain-containing protein [Oceanobacillus senegalensis]|uniref:DUF1836 domain-containing protein n=1 Tax=Oceanobacillus senegalensis TaxID=1936063 RepID=UPI000A30A974|nr:DUF1836 domain-containing protein [Oceanobacillus senegalensis]